MSRRFIIGCVSVWCVLSAVLFVMLAGGTRTFVFYDVHDTPIATLEKKATLGPWQPVPGHAPAARQRLLTMRDDDADVRICEVEELSSGEESLDWNTLQIDLCYWRVVVLAMGVAIPLTAILGGVAALWAYLRRKKREPRGFEVIGSSSGGQTS